MEAEKVVGKDATRSRKRIGMEAAKKGRQKRKERRGRGGEWLRILR